MTNDPCQVFTLFFNSFCNLTHKAFNAHLFDGLGCGMQSGGGFGRLTHPGFKGSQHIDGKRLSLEFFDGRVGHPLVENILGAQSESVAQLDEALATLKVIMVVIYSVHYSKLDLFV